MSRFPLVLVFLVLIACAIAGSLVPRVDREADSSSAEGSAVAASDTVSPTDPVIEEPTNAWPRLFGNHHGRASDSPALKIEWDEGGPTEVWRQPTGIGYSSPIVADSRLIVHSRIADEEVVRCRSVDDGSVHWEHTSPTKFVCDWPPYSSGPYSTPTIHGGRVYSLGAEGVLCCLELTSGDVVWQRNLMADYDVPAGTFAVGHSPLVIGDRMILNVGGRKSGTGVVALSLSNGEELWAATDHPAAYCTPVVANVGGSQFVCVLTGFGIVTLDPASGETFDVVEAHANSIRDAPSAVTPLVVGDRLLISVYQVGTQCFRIGSDGKLTLLWKVRREFESQFNPLVCVDGSVYGWHCLDSSLRCFDLATGDLHWKWKSKLRRGTQIAASGKLILLGEAGHLGWADLDPTQLRKGVLTEEPVLEKPCYSAPALAKGFLFARNEHEIVCFDLRDHSPADKRAARPE